jgi:TDG/mug DNA glycosylase family protein
MAYSSSLTLLYRDAPGNTDAKTPQFVDKGIPAHCYESRCRALEARKIAVWDVLKRSVRPGSLDADIDVASAEPNDFEEFFANHAQVRLVCFNGRKAQDMFRRFVQPDLSHGHLAFALLPSTSPAHASLSLADKLDAWRGIIEPGLEGGRT